LPFGLDPADIVEMKPEVVELAGLEELEVAGCAALPKGLADTHSVEELLEELEPVG
jgi:hypothetical protein